MAKRRLLVPEAEAALAKLRQEVLAERAAQTAQGRPQAATRATGQIQSITPAAQANQTLARWAQSQGVPYRPGGDNGNLTARQAGRIGGPIGGRMVQKLIEIAREELQHKPPVRS
ncbi:MAG: alpha/beta-type small acid-soluble spore protein [Alicyclobacillus sp.]|nr:alpha/beta-type small acid-soluble spore protein [Alicyclobacillus sp.]